MDIDMPLDLYIKECMVIIHQKFPNADITGFFVAPGLILTYIPHGLSTFNVSYIDQGRPKCVSGSIKINFIEEKLTLVQLHCDYEFSHKCVRLGSFVERGDLLRIYTCVSGDSISTSSTCLGSGSTTVKCPRIHISNEYQAGIGIIGSPLFNHETGMIVGLVSDWDMSDTLAINKYYATSVDTITKLLPDVIHANRTFHAEDRTWRSRETTEQVNNQKSKYRSNTTALILGVATKDSLHKNEMRALVRVKITEIIVNAIRNKVNNIKTLIYHKASKEDFLNEISSLKYLPIHTTSIVVVSTRSENGQLVFYNQDEKLSLIDLINTITTITNYDINIYLVLNTNTNRDQIPHIPDNSYFTMHIVTNDECVALFDEIKKSRKKIRVSDIRMLNIGTVVFSGEDFFIHHTN